MPNILTKKIGPLPVWAYGGIVTLGGYLFFRSQSGAPKGQDSSGGQTVPDYAYNGLLSQNIGGDADTIPFSSNDIYNMSINSDIDSSFFGEGPLSLWTAGAMDYSGVFGGGRRRRHRRRPQWAGDPGAYVGDDGPPGAGGYGYHHWHGPGFPPSPVGGEGYDNAGQNAIGGFGGGIASGGGMPFPQQTQVGTQGDQYQVQDGDTYQRIAHKLWGRGADAQALIQANGSIGMAGGRGGRGGSRGGNLPRGLVLTVPGAPHSGPSAPGGPAGNGVGGGSVGSTGTNPGIGAAPPGVTDGSTGQPGAGTSSAGASGGGSPTEGSSNGNSSRVRRGNGSRAYAVSGGEGAADTPTMVSSKPRTGRSRR